MDPEFINSSDWRAIGDILTFLWLLFFAAVGFGFNFLMAHAIIPSLVGSGHLPARLDKARPVFYGGAALALAVVVFALNRAADKAGLIAEFWPRWWI
jgi:hypothetical protein